jgi:hypothetical protein
MIIVIAGRRNKYVVRDPLPGQVAMKRIQAQLTLLPALILLMCSVQVTLVGSTYLQLPPCPGKVASALQHHRWHIASA